MKLNKPNLSKDSNNVELASIVQDACLKGYLDAMKGLPEKKSADIIKMLVAKCMKRHEAVLISAYKAGFSQAKNH